MQNLAENIVRAGMKRVFQLIKQLECQAMPAGADGIEQLFFDLQRITPVDNRLGRLGPKLRRRFRLANRFLQVSRNHRFRLGGLFGSRGRQFFDDFRSAVKLPAEPGQFPLHLPEQPDGQQENGSQDQKDQHKQPVGRADRAGTGQQGGKRPDFVRLFCKHRGSFGPGYWPLSLESGFWRWHSSMTAIWRRTCCGVMASGAPSARLW